MVYASRLPSFQYSIRILLAATLTMLSTTPSAHADTDDTFSVVAGYSLRHEDNLFRLPSGTDPQTALGTSTKSDTIGVATLGFRLNKPYSLQRFELEASLVDYRYQTFDYLNFTARNYAAAWRWQITPAFRGNLTSSRTEALNSFNDYTEYGVRNIRTDENHRLDGILELDGAWRALGGITQTVRTNSETFLEEADTRLNTIEAGLRRDFLSGTSLSLITRKGHGEYFNRPDLSAVYQLDNSFDQREHEIKLTWTTSEKTTIQGRLTHVERNHEHFSARDYAGPVGNLSINWKASDKVLVNGAIGRDLSPYQSDISNYASTDRLTVGALWRVTGKTALRGQYDFSRRNYHGGITDSDDRSDTLRNLKLSFDWQPFRSFLLSAGLEKEKRASNQPIYDFRNTTATVSAQFSY